MSARRMVMIVNPRGGTRRGPRVLDSIRPAFESAGITLTVHETTHAGHARELAATLDLEGYDGLCLIGGDGTIHEVVNGIMQRPEPSATPLGFIPGGTGNDVLRHFECRDPEESVRRIVAGNARPVDVMQVTMGEEVRHCINIVGWGATVDINRTAERLRYLGPPRYTIAALSHILRAKRRQAEIVLDGEALTGNFLLAAACNTRFTGRGMDLAPQAVADDGKIDVVLVRRASRMQMLTLLSRTYDGSHVAMPCVECHQVRSLSITSTKPDRLMLDGELKGTSPVSVDVLPGALRVLV